MTPVAWIAFVAAGAAGAVARYLTELAVAGRATGAFPWGTLVVNVSGSFLLGFLTGLGIHHGLPRTPRVILGVGFCGAFTTFSTFTFETVRLLEERVTAVAVRNIAGTLLAGLSAAAAGLALARL